METVHHELHRRLISAGATLRIERLFFLAAALSPLACGTSGTNPGGTGGAPGSGGSGDDLAVTGGAASGGGQATGAASTSGGSSSGGSGGSGEALDMERVERARKVRRRFSLGDSDVCWGQGAPSFTDKIRLD